MLHTMKWKTQFLFEFRLILLDRITYIVLKTLDKIIHRNDNFVCVFGVSFAGFFIPGFPKLIRYQDHHENILKKFLPKVKKNMVSSYHKKSGWNSQNI